MKQRKLSKQRNNKYQNNFQKKIIIDSLRRYKIKFGKIKTKPLGKPSGLYKCDSATKLVGSMRLYDEKNSSILASQNPKHEYYEKPTDWIIQQWRNKSNAATKRGSELHKYIASTLTNKYQNLTTEENLRDDVAGFLSLYSKLYESGATVISCEQPIAHPKYLITGKPDAIFALPSGKTRVSLLMVDWKSSLQFKLNSPYKFLNPCSHLTQDSITSETLKLFIYKFILEDAYKIQTSNERIVLLGNKCLDLKKEIEETKLDVVQDHLWISFKPSFKYDVEEIRNIIIECKERLT